MAHSQSTTHDVQKNSKVHDEQNIRTHGSLESLIQIVNAHKLEQIESKSETELKELRNRQADVKFLHNVLKLINKKTDSDGKFNVKDDDKCRNILDECRKMGVDLEKGKYKFNKEERDRLNENLHMSIEDLNTDNEMQLQTLSRLTNERYEAWQLARATMKVLDEAKRQTARGIRG